MTFIGVLMRGGSVLVWMLLWEIMHQPEAKETWRRGLLPIVMIICLFVGSCAWQLANEECDCKQDAKAKEDQ
jgi:hypothetical protein